MAAPATTTRSTPLGIYLKDGYQSLYAFALDPDISLWEVEVTPPGFEGGDPIDITTMFNTVVMTKAPQSLYTVEDGSVSCAYDPDAIDEIRAIINTAGSVTQHFPDGSTYDFYGYLRSFKPNGLVRGTMPLADVVIVETSFDPVNRVEVEGVLTEVAGT